MSDYTSQLPALSINKKLGETPSVFDFGATGNGTTDDSAAFNNAIASIVASGGSAGGRLLVPGGYTYLINAPIVTPTGSLKLLIYGDKAGSIIKRGANMPLGQGLLNALGSDLTVRDLLIEGDVTTSLGINYSAQSISITGSAVVSGQLKLTVASTSLMRTGAVWSVAGITGTNFTAGYYFITVNDGTHFTISLPGGASGSYTLSSATATTPGVTDPMNADLTANTSIWIGPGVSGITLDGVTIQHSGGYAVLVDTRSSDVKDVRILNSTFANNRPHLFGTSNADLNYGSWTGGIHYQGDCRTAHSLTTLKGLLVDGCTFKRSTGNQVWGHGYAFDTMHSNVRVTNNYFEDIGRDAVLIAVTSGGVVAGNAGRRIGYICSDDVSAGVPKYLGGQYAVFLDTSGCQGVNYINNSCVSANGAFIDLDGFAYGNVSGNICRVPVSTDVEYAEDSIASWVGNFTYGVQTANNYFTPGGINVSITGNTFINCNYGAIRLFAARNCHVEGNIVNHPAAAVFPPIMLGNFNPASGASQTDSYNNSIVNNNLQWSPYSAAAAVQEQASWSGSPINWSGGEKNWCADNRLSGNCFEFQKDPNSASTTGTLISSEATSLTATEQTTVLRQNFSGVKATSFYGPTGDLHLRYLDAQGQLNASKNGVGGSLTTGVRLGALAVDDSVATSHLYGDGCLILTDTTLGTEVNVLSNSYGLIRFNSTSHVFEQSVSASAGARVWTTLGGSTAPGGSNTQVQFNNSGAFGGSANFTWDNTNKILTLADSGSGSGLIVNGSSSSAVNVPNGTVQANNLTTKNGLYFVEVAAPTTALGIGILYSDSSSHLLKVSLNNGSFVPVATVPGSSNTQVMFSNGTALQGSATFTFAANVLTIGGGAGTGVIAPLFNANAGSTNIEFQGSNFSVTGQGAVATNGWLDFGERAAPSAAAGHAILYADSTSHTLKLSVNGGSFVTIGAGATVAGSNTQVQFNSSGSLGASANFTFASNILTVGSGAGTGVIAPLFNANAGSTNLEFQGSNFSVAGDGHIATNGWLDFGERSAPATALSHGLLYVSTAHALRWSSNNGAFTDIINSAGTYVGPGVSTTSALNGGAFGLWLSGLGAFGTFCQAITSNTQIQLQADSILLSGSSVLNSLSNGTGISITGSGASRTVAVSSSVPTSCSGSIVTGSIISNILFLGVSSSVVTGVSVSGTGVSASISSNTLTITGSGVLGAKTSDLAATYSNSGGYIVLSFINSSGAITCGALSTTGSVNAANYQISGTNGASFSFQDLAGTTHVVNHGLITS